MSTSTGAARIVASMRVTTLIASLFRLAAERRARRARARRRVLDAVGLARVEELHDLASCVDLAIGRTARLREELSR